MRYVIGLDVSYTNTGVAVFKDGTYSPEDSYTFGTKPTEGSHVERASKIANRVLKTLDELMTKTSRENLHIFIEDYAFARATNREAMGEIGGIVKHELWRHGYKFETLPIATIRKVVTGKGNASKDVVMLSLYKRHSIDIPQNDLADAAAVGITGDFVIKGREKNKEMDAWMVDVKEAVANYLKANPAGS